MLILQEEGQKNTLKRFKMEDFEKKYISRIKKAEIIDSSAVKGCNIIRGYGFKLWEMIKNIIDKRLKENNYENMYFPSFIPHSMLKKQDEHYKSFSREVVYCNKAGKEKIEEMAVRPTSETIIYPSIKKWIKTKEDLPLLINQWCSVVRWEILKPNFPLIRDNEFLWHECHSSHSDEEECDIYTEKIFSIYKELLQDYLAIPFFSGKKPERRNHLLRRTNTIANAPIIITR